MRVLTAGASGFLGTRLVTRLREAGHDVVRLVRREPAPGPAGADERRWDPSTGTLDPSTLDGVGAVVNLSGANIGDKRWSADYKRELIGSRTSATGTLAKAVAAHAEPIALLSMSGIHYFGDGHDRVLTEADDPGEGFLSEMTRAWEAATAPARVAGRRVVLMRTGLPLHPAGGVLQPLLLPFRLGVGGPLGNGRSWVPWISMRDCLAAMEFLVERDDIAGPVILAGPEPARWKELATALGRQLHRPAVFPVPKIALNVVAGTEFATEMLMSQRALPAVLSEHGFAFADRTVGSAVAGAFQR
ncbi:TIGR01777 family oxidoreductase [Virgisporangium aurantiacum]